MDLSAGLHDLVAVLGEVVDQHVEDLVAGPGAFAVGLNDAAVDARHRAFGAGLDGAIVDLRMVGDLPTEDLGIEAGDLLRRNRHQLPVDDWLAHAGSPSVVAGLAGSNAASAAAS